MVKPWSVTTTVRNPNRVREFLLAAKELDGEIWDFDTQEKFQILLIKDRVYGYGSTQFTNTLTEEQKEIINDYSRTITINEAADIFYSKKYEDPPMRGRQSFNVLKKFGFAIVDSETSRIRITELGNLFLQNDYDLGSIFLKCFVKWQLPNPASTDYREEQGYNIKPFIGMLHLINRVNELEKEKRKKPKGISRKEFDIFVPTLINYNQIDLYANTIIAIRERMNGKSSKTQESIFSIEVNKFLRKFLGTENSKVLDQTINNLRDYGDNALRYFRLTSFIHVRGAGYYVDLEPLRGVEIQSLLQVDNGSALSFASINEYENYIVDISQPTLPWEERSAREKIFFLIYLDVKKLQNSTGHSVYDFPDFKHLTSDELQVEIDKLRRYRNKLNEIQDRQSSQNLTTIKAYRIEFDQIGKSLSGAVELERVSTLCLNALNDAIRIKPNYPVGDDNNPTSTAPGNCADIECYYEEFNAVCEVTLLRNRDQWFSEGQPVMRHLREFQDRHEDKEAYCLFIAPSIHRDTVNTFWNAIKYGYEGKRQKIVPINFSQFSTILEVLVNRRETEKNFTQYDLLRLYDRVVKSSDNHEDSRLWIEGIQDHITYWKREMLH